MTDLLLYLGPLTFLGLLWGLHAHYLRKEIHHLREVMQTKDNHWARRIQDLKDEIFSSETARLNALEMIKGELS